jgi:hypothetical protein
MWATALMGQPADPRYLHKLPVLFSEFAETSVNARLGHATPACGGPHGRSTGRWCIALAATGYRYLPLTQAGQQWLVNRQAHGFAVEHAFEDAVQSPPVLLAS